MSNEQKRFPGREKENKAQDSFHILPLSMIPLETPGLRKANLVKNARLETAVELFNDDSTGSGQVSPSQLAEVFPSYAEEIQRDMGIIEGLSALDSYDVFSLRTSLRKMGLEINDEYLCLSDDAREELAGYMRDFTRPLIQKIYGSDETEIRDISDMIALFRSADKQTARSNLMLMAAKLRMELEDVPKFLEEYSDIFLSVAYYRKGFDEILPEAARLVEWMQDVKKDRTLSKDRALMTKCDHTEQALNFVIGSLNNRLELFQKHFEKFWADITSDSFVTLKDVIAQNHADIGGVLCGLLLKINLWQEAFPTDTASPSRRAEFIVSEVLPGLDRLRKLEEAARAKLARAEKVA